MKARIALACLYLSTAAVAQPIPTVPITLSSFHITPSQIHLIAGEPVRLLFTNASGVGHDFTAPGFFGRATRVTGPVEDGEIELAGHQTAVVTLVPSRGMYRAKCSHFGHRLLGMSALVIVD